MDRTASPQRPRGPASPDNPQLVREHGLAAANPRKNYAGSSRNSLFGLFRRQPSRSSLRAPTTTGTSLASAGDSFYGAFDNMSLDLSVTSLESPQQAHGTGLKVDNMLRAAERYRKSVEAMSEAAAEFGNTLYECANTKGAASGRTPLPDHHVDTDLQAAGGLHLLISNHANLLASSLQAQLVTPIRRNHQEFRTKVAERESEFRTALRTKMQALKQADDQRSKDSRRRNRDLLAYRSTLLDLTSQIDDINRLKFEFLGDMHTFSTELAESLHGSMASSVTAEIEVFESIARKGWSGGGLDGLLAGCPDPFAPRAPTTSTATTSATATAPNISRHSPVSPRKQSAGTSGAEDTDGNDETEGGGSGSGSGGSGSNKNGEPAKSPNLFSIIPPKPFLPRSNSTIDDDEEDDEGEGQQTPAPVTRRGSDTSDISEIANLTLTPLRVRSHSSSSS